MPKGHFSWTNAFSRFTGRHISLAWTHPNRLTSTIKPRFQLPFPQTQGWLSLYYLCPHIYQFSSAFSGQYCLSYTLIKSVFVLSCKRIFSFFFFAANAPFHRSERKGNVSGRIKLSYGFQLEKEQQQVSDKTNKAVVEERKRGWEKRKCPGGPCMIFVLIFFISLKASWCGHLCASYVSVSVWKTSAWLQSLNPCGSMKHGHMIQVGQWWWWASVVGVRVWGGECKLNLF